MTMHTLLLFLHISYAHCIQFLTGVKSTPSNSGQFLFGPGGPAGPAGPTAPGNPLSPLGPLMPPSPVFPSSPGKPGDPTTPRSPRGPLMPLYPLKPANPFGPLSPLSPTVPSRPLGHPLGHSTATVIETFHIIHIKFTTNLILYNYMNVSYLYHTNKIL